MTPRQLVQSVPYAIYAAKAGEVPDGIIAQNKAPKAVFNLKDNMVVDAGQVDLNMSHYSNYALDYDKFRFNTKFKFDPVNNIKPIIIASFHGGAIHGTGIQFLIARPVNGQEFKIAIQLEGVPTSGGMTVN